VIGLGLDLRSRSRVIRERLLPFLPRRFSLSDPICQLYINNGARQTRFTLLQFPSILSPAVFNDYAYEVRAYRRDGTHVGVQRIEVGPRETCEVKLEELDFFHDLDEFGLFTAQIRPTRLIAYKDRHLGKLTSQFYALYHAVGWESMALVHPQTSLERSNAEWLKWTSGHLFDLSRLIRVEVFQINPTRSAARSALALEDLGGTRYVEEEAIVPPLGTRRIDWRTDALPKERLVRLVADGLTAINAKPLVFCHFPGGAFNGGHS
jgi:hypothetical protein